MPVAETIESFEKLVDGELDDIPEQAFFNVGGVESVLEKAKSLQAEALGRDAAARRGRLAGEHPLRG